MENCTERAGIAKVLEKHGGKLVKEREADAIELVPFEVGAPFSNKVAHPVYSYAFIKDSVSLKQIQDLKDYRMAKLTLATPGKRNPYTAEEEAKMKKYADSHSGSPAVVKFWEDALAKGLDVEHTADSLRHHWHRVMPNKTEQPNFVSLPGKRVQSAQAAVESPVKKVKEEKLLMPYEDELKSIKVIVKNNQRGIYDFTDINDKCEEEEIDEKFLKLVNACSQACGKRISVQEVCRALIARNRAVKPTIDHFAGISSYKLL